MTRKHLASTLSASGLCCGILLASMTGAPNADAEEPATTAEATAEEEVVVIVEGAKLTAEEAQQRAGARMMQMSQNVPPQQLQAMMPQIQQQVVDEFIAQTLLAKEAAKQDVLVADAEVDKTLEQIKTQLPEGLTLEAALEREGMQLSELKENIRRDMTIQKLIEQNIPADVEISDEQVAAFYQENIEQMKTPEQVQARHILLKFDDPNDAEAKLEVLKRAEEIKQKLDAGADFAELAKSESACPSSAQGGDLGSFGRGQMVGPFEEAAFSQEQGVVGPVVETNFGYHIIEVTGHTEEGVVPLDEVVANIRSHLENQQRGNAFTAYIESLKKDAAIEYPNQP